MLWAAGSGSLQLYLSTNAHYNILKVNLFTHQGEMTSESILDPQEQSSSSYVYFTVTLLFLHNTDHHLEENQWK